MPDLSAWPTPAAKADVLLRKAAEVEHALMVQYLYARFSLKAPGDVTDPQQKASLTAWRSVLFQIAKEEMAHLMVVQNLRLFLGLRPTFERDDFPMTEGLFPFGLRLERLTQAALAKYVVAEAPLEPENVPAFPAIVQQATGAAGMPVNHVGVLYALIGVVFASGTQEVEQDASGGDPWYGMVRQIAYLAYAQQLPSAGWHLPDGALHPESQGQQASGAVWVQPANPGMRVPVVPTRAAAKEALRDIGLQGEGPAPQADMMMSHFHRFLAIYTGSQTGTLPFPPADRWPTLAVPTDPHVSNDATDPNAITNPIAQDWANLADLRYTLLLGFLEQYFLTSPVDREFLHRNAIDEMHFLSSLSRRLVALDRGAGGKAALPFTLPGTIHLPEQPAQQWQVHIDRMSAAIALEQQILGSHGAGDQALQQMLTQDGLKLDKLKQVLAGGSSGPGPGGPGAGRKTRFDRVREILEAAAGTGQPSHGGAGRFWNQPRAAFLQTVVYGLKVVETQGDNRGARSALVKALKGEAPFDGTDFVRMPLGRPPVAPADIAFIQSWIDDGCPEDPHGPAPAAAVLQDAAVFCWRPTAAPQAARYDDIWFHDAARGWAVNSDGNILHTADGGDGWGVQLHDPDVYFRSVAFASATRGWAGTLTAAKRLFETSDGGQTWAPVAGLPPDAPPAVCGLCVVNESVIVAAGTNRPELRVAMMRSLDGGRTWTAWDMRPWADNLIDVYFISPDCGWVVGGKADDPTPAKPKLKPVVLYTEDGGRTWVDRVASLRPTFPLGEWGWKIHFVDARVGYISLQNYYAGAVLVTADGGLTWERRPINDPQMNQNIEGIGFVDARHGWVGGWGDHPGRMKQYSSETLDGGASWRDANEIGKNINRFRFLGSPIAVGYASGRSVYKYSADPVPAVPAAGAVPVGRLLEEREPLESSGSVAMDIVVPPGAARLKVQIWDWFGHHVRTLIDDPRPPTGRRRLTWDRTDDLGRLLPPDAFVWRVSVDRKSESRLVVMV
ncbi:MAG: ferritin-like domain-containing protein [Gemmataceae bacterium]